MTVKKKARKKKTVNSTEPLNAEARDFAKLPAWAGIHIGMIEACANGFRETYPTQHEAQEPGGEDVGFFLMQHESTRDVGYTIRWGGSRWSYLVTSPTSVEILDLEKDLDKADCQPMWSKPEPGNTLERQIGSFLIDATRYWLETGNPLHSHCGSCEEEESK